MLFHATLRWCCFSVGKWCFMVFMTAGWAGFALDTVVAAFYVSSVFWLDFVWFWIWL